MIPIAKPSIDNREIMEVVSTMEKGLLAQGELVFDFEKKFANHFGHCHAAAVSNGTVALHVALKSAGVQPGDIVLTTPFSFIATSNAILYCDATPYYVDIDENTYNISPISLKEAIKQCPEAKYLLLVHLFGQSCAMDEIISIAEKNGIKVIEDCAQAHGASFDGQPVGSFGVCGTFSFYPTKNMTTGEGGMLTSSDESFIQHCKKLINHGSVIRYVHEITGYNYRLTNLAAAIGLVQLQKINEMNAKRKDNANFYYKNINNPVIQLPKLDPRSDHVFHQFTLKTEFRDELVDYLTRKNIGTGIYYPIPIHRQQNIIEYLSSKKVKIAECPVTDQSSKKVLAIPVHPSITESELQYISTVINEFLP
ncbi:DegT/DnrJ/EryC1/StrS family aminotransferase [Paenibacillus elgii]|uniref:DegT/DnrJ/EryC1/StrS family aminotransferase n=1 Tax=Paenibacillus elgii TaxID=189691 RepID=UPI000248C3F3|nr:DegT/DnrJ/EryC1/StrS family aminotransferase [Paenibacillus elgii]